MPNWNEILDEIRDSGSVPDLVRRKYLNKLANRTKRNVIVYYSGWLQHPGDILTAINDEDMTGFMSAVHRLDKNLGLDLVLHTPGGDMAATEGIVTYLRSIFGTNIRAIVPHIAMSGGTLIACACREIIMGKHSSLGPIDPQIGGVPAHGVIEEHQHALSLAQNATKQGEIALAQQIIARIPLALYQESQKAIALAEQMLQEWLGTGMFDQDPQAVAKIATLKSELGDHAISLSHARHLSLQKCQSIGLKVTSLESDHKLQEDVLSLHHACIHTFQVSQAMKLIENQKGVAFVKLRSAQIIIPTNPGR